MKVWLVKTGEPLPLSEDVRLLRTGLLAKFLDRPANQVTWWTSSFDHFRKEFIVDESGLRQISPNYSIRFIHSPIGYRKNVSFARLLNHHKISKEFAQQSALSEQPDVIVCSYPTIDLAYESVKYGISHKVPVVVDIRDLWPDIFLEVFPENFKWLGRAFLRPLYKKASFVFNNATALVGLTEEFLSWAYRLAPNRQKENDCVVSMGYMPSAPESKALSDAAEFWRSMQVSADHFNICFFGSLGKQFDIETVIDTAQMLEERLSDVRFVICGNGEFLEKYRKQVEFKKNIIFPGYINKPQIYSLLRLSQLGIAPYKNIENFTLNLPNKPVEYLSAGLPIISSIEGVLGRLIRERSCGEVYVSGSGSSLAEVITRLYHNPLGLKKMKENAHLLFKERFTLGKVEIVWEDFLRNIVENNSKHVR